MSYLNLMDSSLKKAFTLAKDLAVMAVFEKSGESSFDFASGENTTVVDGNVNAKVIAYDPEEKKGDTKVVSKVILVRRREVGALSRFTKVTFDGHQWKFGDMLKDTGVILVARVYR